MVAKAAERLRGKRKKEKPPRPLEEVVQYAVSHQFRVEILILLNQGSFTASEIADRTEISLSNVANHLKRMLKDGAIEVAKKQERNGTMIYWYRAVEIPEYSQAEAEKLTQMDRQHIAGAIVTSGTAEVFAALWKGNLADPRTILSWDWYTVDKKGRAELEAENARHLERIRQIECVSANRVAKTKEDTISILISLAAFVRARKAPGPRSRNCERGQGTN